MPRRRAKWWPTSAPLGESRIDLQADVTRETDVVRLFEATDRELGKLSVLVNNAGISCGFARVDEVTEEMLVKVLAVNVTRRVSVRPQITRGAQFAIAGREGEGGHQPALLIGNNQGAFQ